MKNKKCGQKKKSIFENNTDKEQVLTDIMNDNNKSSSKKTNTLKEDADVLRNIASDGQTKTKEMISHKNNKISKKQKRNFEIKTGVKRVKNNEKIVNEEVSNVSNFQNPKGVKKLKTPKEISETKEFKNPKGVKKLKTPKEISETKEFKNPKGVKKLKTPKEISETKEFKNPKGVANTKETDPIGVKLSKLENEILHKGTIKDKINLLTLIVEKNPSEQNYKNLLYYTENQRNDVIYFVLKNLKDLLISKGVPTSYYIKQKITKCFDINVRNTFIKTKVLRLVYELLKNKKEIETYVRDSLMSLYEINEEAILLNIEDFYFKNMNFKCTNSVLNFLGSVNPSDNKKMIGIYRLILDNISEYKDEQRNIILENCLEHLSTLLEGLDDSKSFLEEDGDKKKLENILLSSYSTDKIAFASIKILFICQNPKIKIFMTNIIKNNIFVRYFNLKEVVEYVKKIYLIDQDEIFIRNILNSSICYKKEFLISILSIIAQNKIDSLYLMEILRNHYSNVVRKMVESILSKEYEIGI
ncbi:hypothetical protein P3W45_001687 [Vairimorpha bombi]